MHNATISFWTVSVIHTVAIFGERSVQEMWWSESLEAEGLYLFTRQVHQGHKLLHTTTTISLTQNSGHH